MSCQCDVCYYSRQVNAQVQKLEDPDAREFFLNMYDMLIHAEFDKDYYKAIVKNEWPQADEILAKYRMKKDEQST